jgi:hypothetical protein
LPTSSATELAEDLYAHLPPAPTVVREVRPYAVLDASAWPAATFSHATRVRDPDVDAVRAWFAGHGRDDFTWWLGPSTTPAGLSARLLTDGAEEHLRLAAMVLEEEPPAVPGVEVWPVETFDDYRVAQELTFEAWETDEEQKAEQRASARERWEAREPDHVSFLAYRDGRPAGRGGMHFAAAGAALTGGAVAPWARGRGAYRALVRARWDAAVERETPTLVTQAMLDPSQPNLERLGFRTVCEGELLRDRSAPSHIRDTSSTVSRRGLTPS